MSTQISGVIKDAELFTEQGYLLLFGIVVEDFKGRWEKGFWMCSSPIRTVDKQKRLVYTNNSIYEVDIVNTPIELPVGGYNMALQGMRPSSVYLLMSNTIEKH